MSSGCAVVRPGHPQANATSLRELAQVDWLSMAAPGIPGDIIRQSFLAAGLPAPVPVVHCGSHSVALDLIAASDIVGLLPPALLRSYVAAGRLVELRLTKPLVALNMGLYTRAGSPASPAAKAAAQIIVAIARRLVASGELRNGVPIVGSPSSQHRRFATADSAVGHADLCCQTRVAKAGTSAPRRAKKAAAARKRR